jgi:hypothetical protein
MTCFNHEDVGADRKFTGNRVAIHEMHYEPIAPTHCLGRYDANG